MKPTSIVLNNQQYRYAIYPNPNTEKYGVFLLGALQEIESVQFFCEEFSKTLNVVVLETPGTGMTPSIDATISIFDQAKFVKNFLQKLEIKKAHMLVFSYSTAIAVELFKIWDGFLSLSVCGGIPGIPKAGRLGTAALLGSAVNSRSDFANGFIDILTTDDPCIPKAKIISRAARKKVFAYSDVQIRCFIENTLRLLVYKPSFSLSKINVPTLLCIGEKDPYVIEDEAKDFINSLPKASLIKIKNADHLTHIQQPIETAEAMIMLAKRDTIIKITNPTPKKVA